MLGNHDQRLWRLLQKSTSAEAVALAQCMIRQVEDICKKYQAKILPYDINEGVYQLGDAFVIHGFDASITAPRFNAATYGKVIFGHTHAIARMPYESFGRQSVGYNIGCLCNKKPDYASQRRATYRWQHGFASGFVDDANIAHIFQQEINDGVLITNEGKIYKG